MSGKMKKQESQSTSKRVVKNAFYQSIYGVIAKIGALIFTTIVARMLFPESFGIYSLALTIIMTVVTLSDLGIGTAITRYVAESLGKGNNQKTKKEARSRFLFLLKFKVISSLVLSILLFILAGIISAIFKKPEMIMPLRVGSIYMFVISLYGIISPLFLATQKNKYSTIAEAVFEISRIALIFPLLYFYKTAGSVFITLSISLLITLVFSYMIISRKYNFLLKGRVNPVEKKRLLLFSGFLALNSLNIVIFTNIDKLMLGYFIQAEFIGYYAAILTVINGVYGLVGLASVIFPVFVQLEKEKLQRAFKKAFKYLSLILFPATLMLAYFILPILQALYGQAYVPEEQRITLLITSVFLSFLVLESTLSMLYTGLFNAKERPKWPALIMFVSAVINITLNFVFITLLIKIKPEYGLIGAAAATFISRYFNLFFLGIMCKKKFKISPNRGSVLKPLLASLIALVFLIVFNSFIKINAITGISLMVSALLIYFLFMMLIKGINKDDINTIKVFKS